MSTIRNVCLCTPSFSDLYICVQVWCILTDTGEADVMDKINTASRPLTVCTYPEVRTAAA